MLGYLTWHDTVSVCPLLSLTKTRSDAHIHHFYGPITVMSKLANIFWTYELRKRLDHEKSSIIVISLNPGAVNTFVGQLPFKTLTKIIMGTFFKKWDEGAYNSAFAAASPLVSAHPEVYKGKYIEGDYGKVVVPKEEGSGYGNGCPSMGYNGGICEGQRPFLI
jgi:hypothetical protein